MYTFLISLLIIGSIKIVANVEIFETDVNFRVEAGSRMCFFEKGKAGQIMELYYQVLDGQHGDLDISIDVIDPRGVKLISDYKNSENSIIMDLEYDGEYTFCLDNTYSVINSKLVYLYFVIEDRKIEGDTVVSEVDSEGKEHEQEEIMEWVGVDKNGDKYTIQVNIIIDTLVRTLNYVVRARHMLDMYSASKSRDSYIAVEDTFIVDVWSAFQITFMLCVGLLQVYVIKKLFDRPCIMRSK